MMHDGHLDGRQRWGGSPWNTRRERLELEQLKAALVDQDRQLSEATEILRRHPERVVEVNREELALFREVAAALPICPLVQPFSGNGKRC
jgi:hypothetical protein